MTQVLPKPIPRARPYWRLLFLIPSLATLGVGFYFYTHYEQGGVVNAIKLSTKQGLVGQAAEAMSNLSSTPDLYLKVFSSRGEMWPEDSVPNWPSIKKDTPIGNGLTWDLPKPMPLREIQRVEVWDHHRITSDKSWDRITMDGAWSIDGQRFHVDLMGERSQPPSWALPVAAVGGALTLLCVLRFIWDQVV
jgi:hypothetical protein